MAIIAAMLCCSSPVFAAKSKNSSAKNKPESENVIKEKSNKDNANKNKSKKTSTANQPAKEKSQASKKDSTKNDSKKSATKNKSDKKSGKTSDKKFDKKNDQKTKAVSQESKLKLVDEERIQETPPPAPEDSVSKKVIITTNDPKGFTKALLYEKEGIDVEIIDEKKLKQNVPKIGFNKEDFFDFSTMLIPVTHEAKLGSPYGIRDHRLHRGVDIHVEKGEPMLAAYPGRVSVSKYNKGGYGHYVIVDHEDGLQTLYVHLAQRLVRVGDVVFPGDIVGLAGNTGRSSGAHLHFEIRYKDININPASIINFPKWELQPGAEHVSKKKILSAHYNMQNKLKKENFYVVKSGDTIDDVARYFYISSDAVCRINNLKKGQPLKVGQKLKGSK